MELRFFGPTFHYIPYHDGQQYQYKQELLRRKNLFENKKWDALQQRIDYEQNRRNQKKERKYQQHNNSPDNAQQQSFRNEDEEKKIQCAPATDHISSTNNNPHNIQAPPTQTNETDLGIYLNELIQNIDDYRYDENDDINDIKSRIRRCIKYAKQNKFKKADNALNPTKIADLNKPELWASLLSKYPHEPLQLIIIFNITKISFNRIYS